MQPDTSTTYLKQGQHFQREGLLSEAEVTYRQVIELNPIFYGSFRYLGEVLALQGKLDQAVEAYQRAKELNPKALWVHQQLGEVFLQLNKLEDAIACFQTAIEINPDFGWAYNALGECWSLKGNEENAIAAYQKAVELNPDSETFRHKLEKVLAEQNFASEEEITDKVEDSLELEKTPIKQKTIEEAIADWRRNGELNSQADNNSLLDSLEPISTILISPEQLAIRSGEIVEKGSRKQLVSPTGNQDLVSYGPYINVPDGLYKIRVNFEFLEADSDSDPVLGKYAQTGYKLDIATEFSYIWQEINVHTRQDKLEFFLELVDANNLEIRFWATGRAFAINSIELNRLYPPMAQDLAADYFFELGKHLQFQGKQEHGGRLHRRVAEVNPEVYLNKAIAYWKQARETEPNCITYFNLGMLLAQKQQVEEAFSCYQKILEIQPEKIDVYSDLMQRLVQQGWGEQIIDCHLKTLPNSYLATKASYNLALEMAKQGLTPEAITLFKKASQKQLSHFEIYQKIWLGLNQLGILNPDNFDLPTEISPEVTYQYFSENSNYKIINLWSLTDSDRYFLEQEGFSIANLELIAKDDIELEELYVNSFELVDNPVRLSRNSKKFERVNKSSYDIKKGRYFQHSIVETGYLYTICPTTGKVLRSNQSFPINSPQPWATGSWHPIHIYRFVGSEVFYLVCALMPIGDKSFIYFPRQELIINFVPGAHSYASETQIINMLKTSLVSYWKGVQAYISSSCQKEVAVDLGWCYNIGHYIWNEMSGLQYLSSNGTLGQVSKFLVGYYEYINIGDTYPEIQPEQIIRWSEPQDCWNLFKTVIDQNYVTVWPTDLIIPEKLANRIYEGAVKRCSPDILQEIEDSKQHFPLIWIAIRSHYRVWLSQVEGIANIINKLYEDYPNLAVVFDGWGRHERHDPRAESEIQRETTIVEEILALVHTDIKAYNLIGKMNYERVVWAKAVDFCIASYGSGLAFPIWIANKRGVIHGVFAPQLFQTGEWSPFIRENLTEYIGLPGDYAEDKSPGYANYDISWQKVYDATINLLKKILKK